MKSSMTAEQWNEQCPVGTPVRYHPIIGEDDGAITSKTRSEAWELGHGAPVVKIEGKAGGVLLEALEVIGEQEELRRENEALREEATRLEIAIGDIVLACTESLPAEIWRPLREQIIAIRARA